MRQWITLIKYSMSVTNSAGSADIPFKNKTPTDFKLMGNGMRSPGQLFLFFESFAQVRAALEHTLDAFHDIVHIIL
jgi:hypothetical protein